MASFWHFFSGEVKGVKKGARGYTKTSMVKKKKKSWEKKKEENGVLGKL